MLEYRRVLVRWQAAQGAHTGLAMPRPAGPGALGRRLLRRRVLYRLLRRRVVLYRLLWCRLLGRHVVWRHVVWQRLLWRGVPGRRDAVTMALHQAALLSSARIPACTGSPRNATARSRPDGSPGAPAARLIRH